MAARTSGLLLLLLASPREATGYSRGAGSCHTASGGHGSATAGNGGFAVEVDGAPSAGATVTLRLSHPQRTAFKGFLITIRRAGGGDYDGGGASFAGLGTHALAQSKDCFGPAAATHRNAGSKQEVALSLQLPAEPTSLVVSAAVVISRSHSRSSEWYSFTRSIEVGAAQTSPPPPPPPPPPPSTPTPTPQQPQPEREPEQPQPQPQPQLSLHSGSSSRGGPPAWRWWACALPVLLSAMINNI